MEQYRPFRQIPSILILPLGPSFQQLKFLAQGMFHTGPGKDYVERVMRDLVDYVADKLDAPGNLIEFASELSLKDTGQTHSQISECVYNVGLELFESYAQYGIYNHEGYTNYRFNGFIDSSTVVLKYDISVDNVSHPGPFETPEVQEVKEMIKRRQIAAFDSI